MRKLILKMSMSLDGFVCGPNGEIDWMFKSHSPDAAAWTVQMISQAGAHVMGHKTFNDMAAYWPNSSEVFATPMNEIHKIVFSRLGFSPAVIGAPTTGLKDAIEANRADGGNMVETLPRSAKSWAEARVITGDLAHGIKELKQLEGNPLVAHGGAGFAASLVQTALIDEFWLLIHPVAIGRGLSPFAALQQPQYLKLVDTKTFSGGAVAQVYRTP